ncbi:alcohol dehydrogenase [Janibacter sp. Soil728]|uniref:NADP-dependent oxidoreductase n=1 Tax=Janibacter sp. Soil728 TaxID=1736393 RepID=UPI000700B02A|nr:NADP-dependent oxidoreductase [Janibacter sp. Soil728]KRE35774.1 alcohol dehydrogenase [Janibacter sp. Soil728]
MRAMTYDRYGDDDELRMTDRPVPKVGPGEVRVQVTRASVNPVDWKLMSGGLDALMDATFPVIPGWDVAGVVDAVGPDTPEFVEGDRVAAYARKQIVSAGTFAEYVSVMADDVAAVPDEVGDDVAAALPLTGLTALRVLETLAVTKGDTLLIHAASGGVGFLASQLAVAAGATVVGTASPANHDKLTAIGVTPVAYGEGLQERLREVAPDGFDAVADLVGGVLDVSLDLLREGGRLASIADPAVEEHGGRWVWVRPDGERLSQLLEEVAAGRITVEIDRTFPLAQVADAFAASREGSANGKIVIEVTAGS